VKKTQYQKDLTKRYFVWCYKTTKEELDRIERYFTQFEVDAFVLKKLRSTQDYKKTADKHSYRNTVNQFEKYMEKKKTNVLSKKYSDKKLTKLNPQYQYLKNRLSAIESAIDHFLGKKEREVIRRLYEEEMTRRILQATDH